MKSRLARKQWSSQQMGLKGAGSIFDAFDDALKSAKRITDKEYDAFAETATDNEIALFIAEKLTFSEKRQLLKLLHEKVYQ